MRVVATTASAIALSCPWIAHSALSVLPHQSDGIVMQLRSAILFDEKDLIGPLPPSECSSLSDGPFCDRFIVDDSPSFQTESLSGRSDGQAGSDFFISRGDQNSAQFVVDGVLSARLQDRNKEAFDWGLETYRVFSQLVSKVISDSLLDREPGRGSPISGSFSGTRTGSKCFSLALNTIMPSVTRLPQDFANGFPTGLAPKWEGQWDVQGARSVSTKAEQSRKEHLPWATRLVLKTSVGYIRFQSPVVIRCLLVGIPSSSKGDPIWGQGGLVCGRAEGKEQWCVYLDHKTALAHGPEGNTMPSDADFIYAEIGNSLRAADEIAFVGIPSEGLYIAKLEVVATHPAHPRHGQAVASRQAVLLKRSGGSTYESKQVEPVLATVARDAAVWDLNDVLRNHMQLRSPRVRGKAGSESKRSPFALRSFRDMLKGLQDGTIQPPHGVRLAQLKKEVRSLIASTKEVQDDDVLVHSKIESLLQVRMREKNLDALLALQAEWQRNSQSRDESLVAEPADGNEQTAKRETPPATDDKEGDKGE